MGLNAWRRLSQEYDPVNATSNRKLLRRLVHPKQVSLDVFRRPLKEWVADPKEYKDRTGGDFEENQKCLSLQDMCPTMSRTTWKCTRLVGSVFP